MRSAPYPEVKPTSPDDGESFYINVMGSVYFQDHQDEAEEFPFKASCEETFVTFDCVADTFLIVAKKNKTGELSVKDIATTEWPTLEKAMLDEAEPMLQTYSAFTPMTLAVNRKAHKVTPYRVVPSRFHFRKKPIGSHTG